MYAFTARLKTARTISEPQPVVDRGVRKSDLVARIDVFEAALPVIACLVDEEQVIAFAQIFAGVQKSGTKSANDKCVSVLLCLVDKQRSLKIDSPQLCRRMRFRLSQEKVG